MSAGFAESLSERWTVLCMPGAGTCIHESQTGLTGQSELRYYPSFCLVVSCLTLGFVDIKDSLN